MNNFYLNSQRLENILILGGLHGDELTPLVLLEKFRTNSIPAGNVRVFPFVNRAGLMARVHEDPNLGGDLNRMFDDREKIRTYYPELVEAIDWADVIIDLHTHQYTQTLPYAVLFKNDEAHQQLALDLGMEFCEIPSNNELTNRAQNTLIMQAQKLGKRGLVIEMSNLGYAGNQVELLFASLQRFLADEKTECREFKIAQKMTSPADFIVTELYVDLGSYVNAGDKLWSGFSLEGERVEIMAEKPGIVVTMPTKTLLKKGFGMGRLV